MSEDHKDTGYYDRPPTKREREAARAKKHLEDILKMLDEYPKEGNIETQDNHNKQAKGDL